MRVRERVFAVSVTICVLSAFSVAAATSFSKHPALERYATTVDARIAVYSALLRRLDSILSEQPMVNVDPKVEKLYKVSDDLNRLVARWKPIEAPEGLKVRHSGMGRALEFQAQGWRIYASALFTRDADEIHAAIVKLGGLLRSAAYLQKRWAAALRGALVRADLLVPKWLGRMATAPQFSQ